MSIARSSLTTRDKLKNLCDIIEVQQPEWLYIQPSILMRLIEYYNQYNRKPPSSIRYIESVGEILSSSTRRGAQELFMSPVVNLYGSEEMLAIAYECPHNKMHILTDNVYVECLQDGKISQYGKGSAIITNLSNYAMPLIRYEQGDVIVKKS